MRQLPGVHVHAKNGHRGICATGLLFDYLGEACGCVVDAYEAVFTPSQMKINQIWASPYSARVSGHSADDAPRRKRRPLSGRERPGGSTAHRGAAYRALNN